MAAAEIRALEEVYARWGRGDWSDTQIFAEDIVFTTFDADGDEVVRQGLDGMADWLRGFLKQWRDFKKELRTVEQSGNRFLVTVRQSGTGRSSGIPLDMPTYDVWTIENGRASALYVTRHEDAARRVFTGERTSNDR